MTPRIPTQVPDLSLRFAQREDVGVILGFIRELAEYEKLTHEVVADEKTLGRALFGGRQVAEVVIAEYQEEPVGFALFFHAFSTFLGKPGIYLEDLYVKPVMRGKGVGTMLLTFLAKVAKDRGCGRLEWAVLDWNEPAIRFYEKLGAQAMNDWTVYRVTGPALEELANRY